LCLKHPAYPFCTYHPPANVVKLLFLAIKKTFLKRGKKLVFFIKQKVFRKKTTLFFFRAFFLKRKEKEYGRKNVFFSAGKKTYFRIAKVLQ
jgi:hypothetical protein